MVDVDPHGVNTPIDVGGEVDATSAVGQKVSNATAWTGGKGGDLIEYVQRSFI